MVILTLRVLISEANIPERLGAIGALIELPEEELRELELIWVDQGYCCGDNHHLNRAGNAHTKRAYCYNYFQAMIFSRAATSGIYIISWSRIISPFFSNLVKTLVTVSRAKPLRLLSSR